LGGANVLEEKEPERKNGDRREEREGLALHCFENPIYVFPEIKLRGFVPNYYIHLSVSNLYIPGSVCLFGCKIGRPILGLYKLLRST
jgi:hypothetical protein